MKKIFITLNAALLCITASAQQKQVNDGGVILKGGLNLANISVTNNGKIDDAKMLPSFHVGLVADLPVASFFSIQPGVLLTGKGSKTEIYLTDNTDDNYIKTKTKPLYIEVPLNAVFKLPIGDASNFFIGAGPYAAVGIGGKTKGTQKFLGVSSSYEKDIEFNNDDPTTSGQEDADVYKLRRFDYGLNGLAGIETDKIVLSVGYGHGLAKLGSTEDNNENDKNKHRVISISLGFKL